MATEDCVLWLFCLVDDRLACRQKHPQARLWPSELITIGLLYALKGGSFRSFYRWLERDYADLFGGLPERTRLLRALRTHHAEAQVFLADPTFFTVIAPTGSRSFTRGGMGAVRARWARRATVIIAGAWDSSCAG